MLGAVPACGDSGGTPTASETQGASTQITLATSVEPTDPTGATGPGTTPTTSPTGVTEGSATAGETFGTTTGAVTTTGPTGTTTSSTGDTTATSTTGTTMGVDPGTGTTGTTGTTDGDTTGGPKLDMGPQACDPDPQAATFDFIWIANSTQGTVSEIKTLSAANCGVYGRIQAVG